ncbi:hypothetical protein V1291_005296 [Nitrobacteraceae bacterium AZCC 1564]
MLGGPLLTFTTVHSPVSLQSEYFMSRQLLNAFGRIISKMAPASADHLTFLAVALFAILVSAAPFALRSAKLKNR